MAKVLQSLARPVWGISLARSFVGVMLIGSVATLAAGILTHSNVYPDAGQFFKFLFIFMLAIAACYCVRAPLPRDGLLATVALMGLWGGAVGLLERGINGYTFSHIYGVVMPLILLWFGHYVGQLLAAGERFYTPRFLKLCTVATGAAIVLYYILYKMKVINYFGMDSPLHFLGPMLLAEGAKVWFLTCALLVLFTGKRSIFLLLLGQALLYMILARRGVEKDSKLVDRLVSSKMAIIGCIASMITIAAKLNLLDRFKNIATLNFETRYDIYVATGGRCLEVEWLFKYLNTSPIKYLIGGGWGDSFDLPITLNATEMFTRHYSHFSPGYGILVYGIPFTLLLYGHLFHTFFAGIRYATNPFVLIFISLFVQSFSGALLFADVHFWVFFGIARSYISRMNKTSPLPRLRIYLPWKRQTTGVN